MVCRSEFKNQQRTEVSPPQRAYSLGSLMSLKPSPSKLKPKIEIRIASPAKTDTQGAIPKKSTPARTMLPKVGVGGGTPTPKKLKLASSLIAVPSQSVLITRI